MSTALQARARARGRLEPETLLRAGERIGARRRLGRRQQRAEDLVALVTNLYGAGLERLLQVLADVGRLDQQALDALADDELVAGLLLVHGLHPYDVADPSRASTGQRAALPRLAWWRRRAAGGRRRRRGHAADVGQLRRLPVLDGDAATRGRGGDPGGGAGG